jgi:hypothetical protein
MWTLSKAGTRLADDGMARTHAYRDKLEGYRWSESSV